MLVLSLPSLDLPWALLSAFLSPASGFWHLHLCTTMTSLSWARPVALSQSLTFLASLQTRRAARACFEPSALCYPATLPWSVLLFFFLPTLNLWYVSFSQQPPNGDVIHSHIFYSHLCPGASQIKIPKSDVFLEPWNQSFQPVTKTSHSSVFRTSHSSPFHHTPRLFLFH